MGRHRRRDRRGANGPENTFTNSGSTLHIRSRRRIAAWPVVSLVLIGLSIAGWFGWNWAGRTLEHQAEAQAADCNEGEASVHLAVDPAMEQQIRAAAHRWEEHRGVVHGHCIHMNVHSASSDDVLDVLLEHDPADAIGGAPTAWIPESSAWVDRLTEQQSDITTASSRSLASDSDGDYPYLPLTENADDVQQRAVQSFRTYLLAPEQQTELEHAGFHRAE